MPQYPASSFESAVGGFMQGYGTVRDMRRQNAEDARLERAARQAEQMRQIELEKSGYQEVDFTLPPDPSAKPESMASRIGNRLLGRDTTPERDVRMLKMGPSEGERVAAEALSQRNAEREDTQAFGREGWARDDARSATEAAAREREARLNRASNREIAGIQQGSSFRADSRENAEVQREERDRFIATHIAAGRDTDTGPGRGTQAMRRINANPDLMRKARQYGVTQADWFGAGDAFAEQRRLNDATVLSRTTDKVEAPRVRRSEGANTGTVPGVAQQQQAWDRAAAALRAQGKDPAGVIGPRP